MKEQLLVATCKQGFLFLVGQELDQEIKVEIKNGNSPKKKFLWQDQCNEIKKFMTALPNLSQLCYLPMCVGA